MAIATATAIGLGISAAATGASFAQAGKQRKLQREAQAEAQRAMQEARQKLDVNFYKQLGIQKEPYELEREALLSTGAQLIEAGVESERGAAATAGRVQMAQQAGQRQIAAAMGQEMAGLEKATVGEATRLRDMGIQLDLAEVAGAQQAERDAQRAAAAATTQGLGALQTLGSQVLQSAPLYGKTESAAQAAKIDQYGMEDMKLSQMDMQKSIASLGKVNNIDFSKVASMTPMQYQDFMGKVDVETLKTIREMLPNTLQSFRPAEYALPTTQQNFYNPFAIPGIGGR